MHILLISMYFNPVSGTRLPALAKELLKHGHEVTILTGFGSYPSGYIEPAHRMRFWHRETVDGFSVLRILFLVDRSKSKVMRVLSYLSFALMASLMSFFLIKKPDVIWTYQIGLPGVLIGYLKNAPLIHEVQDLWPEWGKTIGLNGGALFQLLDWQQRFVYRSAQSIITISNGFKRVLMTKGVQEDKITLISNWANQEYFYPVARELALGEREGLLNGSFNVMYAGNIGTAQGVHIVLEAAKLLQDLPDVRFILYGDGVEREGLVEQIKDQNLTSVQMPGSRPVQEISQYLAFADVVLILLIDDADYAITIPSKTYGYLATGRPIIASASGDVAELVTELHAGFVCSPQSVQALADAIRRAHAMPSSELQQLGENGLRAFKENFTQQVLMNRYIPLFEAIGKNKHR